MVEEHKDTQPFDKAAFKTALREWRAALEANPPSAGRIHLVTLDRRDDCAITCHPMEAPKVYLETTLFYFFFTESGRQYHGRTVKLCQDTRRFFEAIKARDFEPYTSVYVVEEIRAYHSEELRNEMLKLITDYGVKILPKDEREKGLADLYIEAAAFPARYMDDALHVASATVHGLDFIVSLNFEHIVKDKAIRITVAVNEAEGYEGIGIYEPGEVMDYEWN